MRKSRRVLDGFAGCLAAGLLLTAALGCSQDGPGHPDTGVGANQAVPATIDCLDFCQRLSTCITELCDEDTSSTRYDAYTDLLMQSCESTCTEATLTASISQANWQCTFVESCREVLEESACGPSSYHCS